MESAFRKPKGITLHSQLKCSIKSVLRAAKLEIIKIAFVILTFVPGLPDRWFVLSAEQMLVPLGTYFFRAANRRRFGNLSCPGYRAIRSMKDPCILHEADRIFGNLTSKIVLS